MTTLRRRTAAMLLALVVAFVLGTGACSIGELSNDDQPAPDTAGGPSVVPAPPLRDVSPEIAALADRTTMTEHARRVFYETDPQLVGKAELAESCPLLEESAVLGCYGSGRITILRVGDPRLEGMEEVTAAHEMLHAAWDGFEPDERERLGRLLRDELDRVGEEEIRERIERYRQRDPSVVDNELHSILGTEVASLSPELVAHYAGWFADRLAVVALADRAQSELRAIEGRVAELDAELGRLGAEIDAERAALDAMEIALAEQERELARLREANDIDAFNAAVPRYNEAVTTFNDAATAHRRRVDQHNLLVDQRNALVAEFGELVDRIDTSVGTVPAGPP